LGAPSAVVCVTSVPCFSLSTAGAMIHWWIVPYPLSKSRTENKILPNLSGCATFSPCSNVNEMVAAEPTATCNLNMSPTTRFLAGVPLYPEDISMTKSNSSLLTRHTPENLNFNESLNVVQSLDVVKGFSTQLLKSSRHSAQSSPGAGVVSVYWSVFWSSSF